MSGHARAAKMREATLNAWDARFWLSVPLPLAEVGSRLNASEADYLDRLLELFEDATALATALALARITACGSASESFDAFLKEHLARPALGTRIGLLMRLEQAFPRISGWDFEAHAREFGELFALGRVDAPRTPRLRDVFGALTTIRNDGAHRRLSATDRRALARVVEQAVFSLIRENRSLHQPLLFVYQARLTSEGHTEITALSLNGPAIASYRRGRWQPAGTQRVLPERVYLGTPEALIDAHPFIVLSDERVFVLDQLRGASPVLRHFFSREALDESLEHEWRSRFGHPPEPRPRAPETFVLRRRLIAPYLAFGCSAFALFTAAALALAGVLVGSRGSEEESAQAVAAARQPVVEAPRCRGQLPPSTAFVERLPQLFSGAPIGWGSKPSELEAACSGAKPTPFGDCRDELVEIRAGRWPGALDFPGHRSTVFAFHRQDGLFEIMVYSDSTSAELKRVLEGRLGPRHWARGNRGFWEYERGGERVSIKVTGLGRGHPAGTSAIRMIRVQVAARYSEERRALCTE